MNLNEVDFVVHGILLGVKSSGLEQLVQLESKAVVPSGNEQ